MPRPRPASAPQRTSRRSRTRFSSVIAVLALGLAACTSDAPEQTGEVEQASGGTGIALILKTETNPFFVAMKEAAETAASQQSVRLTVASGKYDGDADSQIAAIEDAIARKDKGILITPNDPEVNAALKKAKEAGLLTIALDTPPALANVVDVSYSTDNLLAGKLIGEWAAKKMKGKDVVIAMLNLLEEEVVSSDLRRNQGFLLGMGIDAKDLSIMGDADKVGKYSGGNYDIVCEEHTQGAKDGGRRAMEACLKANPNVNLVYTVNEPAATGAIEVLKAAKNDAVVVSVDGGCDPGMRLVASGEIDATSMQFPMRMVALAMDAVLGFLDDGTKPTLNTSDSAGDTDFISTGVSLITDDPQEGMQSLLSVQGRSLCWSPALK